MRISRCCCQGMDVHAPREAGDVHGAASEQNAAVISSRLESDTLKRFQKKASSPLSTKRYGNDCRLGSTLVCLVFVHSSRCLTL